MYCKLDEGALLNLRCVLLGFQIVCGVNINLTKSELVRLSDGDNVTRLANVLGCKRMELSIKYLNLLLCATYKDVRA